MTVTLRTGRPLDIEQGMIEATVEATIEATTTPPPIGAVSSDTMMITTMIITTMIIMVTTAMDIAVKAATVAAEEAYTSVV